MVPPKSGHASLIGSAFGGYEVQALIGRGAMGTVYLARDIALNRQVALKVLLGSIARNPSMVRSFYREAQAAAPLRHPGIVRVYSAGIEGGTPYIAMEYVAGEPLDRFLRRKGQVSWQAALYVGGQVAAALQCAHDAGIIHRDVKPANILLDRQGRVRLADFGIARVRAMEQGSGEAGIIGTPQYMSPEQCAGEEVSAKADLYSLGVTLYQMISGETPFQANSPQALMRKIASEAAPRLNRVRDDVPDDVARLIAHLLEKNEADRPADAAQVCQTIERLQCEDGGRSAIPQALAAYVREQAQDSPLRLMTPPPSKDKSKTVRPETAVVPGFSKRWLAFSSVAFATLACIAGASVWFGMQDSRPAAPAHVMNASRFQPQPDGSMIAELPVPAYTAVRLGWAGAEPALLVEVQGMEHLMSRGSAGILAFAPESKQCMNIATPAGASLAEGIDSARAYPLALSSGQRSASTTPTILLAQRGANNAKSTGLVFAQRWNEAAPSINPLATYESTAPGTAPWHSADARAMHAVLRPDGGAVCAIIENADGTNYLAEQRVNGGSPLQKLTGTGARILPHSVQYAPDGTRVYYMRQDNAGKQELWSTPVAGTDSTLLMVGYFDGGVAISPDGSRIATAWSTTAAEQAELRVIDAKDGKILHRLDPGIVGHDAWAHTADRLLIAARGDDRIRQLQLIDPENPATRRVLTSLPGGVGKATALSADGRWAAGIAEGGSGVRVVFVDLNDPESTRTAARTTATDVNRL